MHKSKILHEILYKGCLNPENILLTFLKSDVKYECTFIIYIVFRFLGNAVQILKYNRISVIHKDYENTSVIMTVTVT